MKSPIDIPYEIQVNHDRIDGKIIVWVRDHAIKLAVVSIVAGFVIDLAGYIEQLRPSVVLGLSTFLHIISLMSVLFAFTVVVTAKVSVGGSASVSAKGTVAKSKDDSED